MKTILGLSAASTFFDRAATAFGRRGRAKIAISGLTVLVAAGSANTALGQSSSDNSSAQGPNVVQVAPRQEPGKQPTPAQAAEDYDAKGMRLGSYRLFAELALDEVYNDNIYASSATTGRVGSFVQLVKPTIELKSDWQNHMLNFFAKGAFGFYSADANQNFQDVSVGANGRLDIQREWNVYGGASYNRQHEELGTPNTLTGGFQPTIYNQISGNVGYYQRFGLFKTRLDGRIDNYNYLNNGTGPTQGLILNTDRNRTEFRESARLGYEFSPNLEVWTRGTLNQRRYDTGVDSFGFAHNSSGWDVVGGLAIDFGGITSLEMFAGYVQQDYVDSRFQSVRAPTFGLTGYWNPIRELWIKPFVRRTVDDTSVGNASGYLNTAGGLDINYNLRPNVRLDGHGDYSVADYQAVSTTANRYDQYLTLRAGVMYFPTPNFFVGPTYQYVHRTSNQFNSDYDQNVFMLKLGARL